MTGAELIKGTGAAALAAALAGCGTYVTRAEYDADLAELRAADARLANDLGAVRTELASLKRDLEARLRAQDGRIAELSGRLRVDTTAHFAYDDATLREEDKAALDDFAKVIRKHESNVVITVEGFADPAGSAAYNKDLGQRRANAVRSYLVDAGMAGDRVRAVSYGADRNRQVKPGAWGKDGLPNRRAALVIDYVATTKRMPIAALPPLG